MHSLRHTAISHLANNPQVPLTWTQRFARHSSLNITQAYIHDVQNADVDDAAGATLEAVI